LIPLCTNSPKQPSRAQATTTCHPGRSVKGKGRSKGTALRSFRCVSLERSVSALAVAPLLRRRPSDRVPGRRRLCRHPQRRSGGDPHAGRSLERKLQWQNFNGRTSITGVRRLPVAERSVASANRRSAVSASRRSAVSADSKSALFSLRLDPASMAELRWSELIHSKPAPRHSCHAHSVRVPQARGAGARCGKRARWLRPGAPWDGVSFLVVLVVFLLQSVVRIVPN
jgi:hypothetical protein